MIVTKLYMSMNMKKEYTDGLDDENGLDIFDYESQLKNRIVSERRSKNLKKFLMQTIAEIIEPNINYEKRR